MLKFFDWSALLGYCGFIYWLSAKETLPMPMLFIFQDKLVHAGAYFVMGIFSWRAFRHRRLKSLNLVLICFIFCSVYGMSDEWHQYYVPGRSSSIWDWLADSVGAAMALGLLVRFGMIKLEKSVEHSKSRLS